MLQKKALVVDDSKLALFVLKKMLLEESLAVDTVQSAEEALGYLVHNKPDVIFMDHSMPGMDGLQALRIIKENPDTATIPIMMYTSKEGEVYMSQARALGAVDILPKQLEPVVLNKVLRRMHLIEQNEGESEQSTYSEVGFEKYQTPAPDNVKELAKLVKNAEAALEKETLKQFLNQELEQQAGVLNDINKRLARLAVDSRETRADVLSAEEKIVSRDRSLVRPLMVCLILLAFGYGYLKVNENLDSLGQKISTVFSESVTQPAVSTYSPASYNELQKNVDVSGLLYVLEESIGDNYELPYGQPLLGDEEMQLLANLLLSLDAIGYTGNLEILVHSGNFCVVTNQEGKYVLPSEELPIVDCQINETNVDLEGLVVTQLRDFVGEVNAGVEKKFNVIVVNWGSTQPLEQYPDTKELVSAGTWNETAQRNQRIEIVFR